MKAQDSTATRLLHQVRAGDPAAQEALLEKVYSELHHIAERLMRGERPGHTLQPTALVNETWLRLFAGETRVSAENQAQFLQVAARAMRNVLIDHARRRATAKRACGPQVDAGKLDFILGHFDAQALDVLAVDEALERLEVMDEGLARVVELRFFAGLTVPEVARTLGASVSGVERSWRLARAWLRRQLPQSESNRG